MSEQEAESLKYEELLELAVDLAYQLQQCGAETYRVEETILRLMDAYGVQGEAFSIPNCIIASLETPEEKHLTRMRRTNSASTNLDGVERYNALCRKICQEKPPVAEAMEMLRAETRVQRQYSLPLQYLGHAMAASGFCLFFRGTMVDALCAAVCGIAVGACSQFMSTLRANLFFKTVSACFVMAFLAQVMGQLGLAHNVDSVTIGTMMLLVPGLLFTISIRDIIYGDTMSGTNRLVQVFIIAVALAVGTGAAVGTAQSIWGVLDGASRQVSYSLPVQCLVGAFGSMGFCLLLNIRGKGTSLCLVAAVLSWVLYSMFHSLGVSMVASFVLAAAAVSSYAEVMARIRKCPAIGYMLVSMFPLVPGADIYYTMDYALRGDIDAFLHNGLRTGALAGALAIGMLLASTAFRMWGVWRYRKMRQTK